MEGPLAAEVSDPGRVEARGDCGVLDLAGLHVTVLVGPRCGQDQAPAVHQVGQRVDEHVNKVAVKRPEPHQDPVGTLAVALVLQRRTDDILDADPQRFVDVLVPAELLNDLPGVNPSLASPAVNAAASADPCTTILLLTATRAGPLGSSLPECEPQRVVSALTYAGQSPPVPAGRAPPGSKGGRM